MPLRGWYAVMALSMMLASEPALACRLHREPNLDEVKQADVVVIGKITEYQVIRHEGVGSYSRFIVQVDQVIVGKVGDRFPATWENSTFGQPDEMAEGPYLIALHSGSTDNYITGSPHREPNVMSVLQEPCSRALMFEISSNEARITRDILAAAKE